MTIQEHSDSVTTVASVRDMPARKYLRENEAAKYLGFKSRVSFWKLRKRYPGKLPYATFGGREKWFRVTDIDAFIELRFQEFALNNQPL